MTEPVIQKLKEFIRDGEVKIELKDGRIVCAKFRIDDKENKIKLDDLKGGKNER